jgi:hypothetical protein
MKSKKAPVAAAPVGTKATSAPSPLTPVGGAAPLPATGAPTPPAAGSPVPSSAPPKVRVLQGEVDVAESAARELRSSTTFPPLLSAHFGSANEIANALEFAVSWYREVQTGTTWNDYAKEQSAFAWGYTLTLIERLRATFQAVAAADPAIVKELPNFVRLLDVKSAVALKGVETKRKIASGEIVVNKQAKPPRKGTKASTRAKQTATATAPAPSPVEAPAPTPAAPGANGVTPVANGAGTTAAH